VDVILQRAIHRGELPPDVDFELVNDLLLRPLYTRAVVRGRPLTPELADQIVDIVVAALRADGLRAGKNANERQATAESPSPDPDHQPHTRRPAISKVCRRARS
jgi:Tetracyclin repressor-like, C-terminal domain